MLGVLFLKVTMPQYLPVRITVVCRQQRAVAVVAATAAGHTVTALCTNQLTNFFLVFEQMLQIDESLGGGS